MDEITKALYSNFVKTIREQSDEIQEYDFENEQDYKEIVEFLKLQTRSKRDLEYQGRKVKLGKPMRGDVKKFKVYVKNPQGNVVKVNFGHGGSSKRKNNENKKNPQEEKSFRARHNCDNPGPRHKAKILVL